MSTSNEDIVNLECVLIRLGSADTDEQLQAIVHKYLPLLLSKISSTESNVRSRVMEVLTHINKRIRSRPLIQVPIEPLLELYKDPQANSFLINFAIIYIKIGYPRLNVKKQVELAPFLLSCLEGKPEMHYDKIFPLVLPILSELGQNKNITRRENILGLDSHPQLKNSFLNYVCDILLLPYGYNQDITSTGFTPPPAMSMYSFKRVTLEPLKPEELQKLKESIMTFLSSGALSPEDSLLPLIIASADTRFSVVNPAISELARITPGLDWSNGNLMKPLYMLFSGSIHKLSERKTSPADPRVKMKVLQYLYKVKSTAMNATLALKVIFEGLFGNTNDKCRKMTLSFAKLMITECSKDELKPVITILFNGLLKMTSTEDYPFEIRNAAYLTLSIIPTKCPEVFLQRRDLVVMLFDKITQEAESVQSSIRDLLVAIAPLFRYEAANTAGGSTVDSHAETNLVLALLARHIEGTSFNAAFVASAFLMTCFPAENVAAKYLMLMGLHNDLLKEKIFTDLYGTYKLDGIKYSQLKSFDTTNNDMELDDIKNSTDSESERTIILPSFKSLVEYVYEQASKRKENFKLSVAHKNGPLPYNAKVYTEVIKYIRLCLFMSAGLTGPSPFENVPLLAAYLSNDGMKVPVRHYIALLKELLLVSKGETELSCMIDILGCAPEMAADHMDLLPVVRTLLQDTSREKRDLAATLYGMLSATLNPQDFDKDLQQLITQSRAASVSDENKHGVILAFSNSCERRLRFSKKHSGFAVSKENYTSAANALLCHILSSKPILIEAACVGISLIGKCSELPLAKGQDLVLSAACELSEVDDKAKLTKKLYALMIDATTKTLVREKAVLCLGHICTGERFPWTKEILEGFMSYLKETRDVDMHLNISKSIVCCILGVNSPEAKDVWSTSESKSMSAQQTDDDPTNALCEFVLEHLLATVKSPHPSSRQACSIWLLAIVKSCSEHPMVKRRMYAIQSAFIDLLSEENDIVQDSASNGLGLVYLNSDADQQKKLAVTLLEQLSGGSRSVKQVTNDTTIYQEGVLGKAPTGGNLSTYKELCSLASDLNQPDLIYKFMQLANHNANWNSKLGAAFGIQSIASLAQQEIQVYLPKIISRLYRYKYDPIPKIQNSMCAIWNAIVQDNKSTITQFHGEIIADILSNITHHQWRVRMSCCLALSDLLRSHPLPSNEQVEQMWLQLFRVMDDVHEATRKAAENTMKTLSKVCVVVCKSDSGLKAGSALASTFLPVLLDTGITNTVKEIRNISLHTISELVQYSGPILQPHMPRLIPALLAATGELESAHLNHLSAMWGARQEAQEALDCARADAAKGHVATKTMSKCIEFMDFESLAATTPCVVDLMRNSMVLGTRVACTHYLNIIVSVKRAEAKRLDKALIDRIFSALHTGLGDRNAAVKRSHAEAIGHLVGIAQEASLQKFFDKLWKAYFSNKTNKRAAIARTVLSISHSEPDVLRTYSEKVIPLVFFAMHEDKTEENTKAVEMWDNIWNEITSGDADIKHHFSQIMSILKTELESPQWTMKAQAANAVSTVAKKVGSTLSEEDRKGLIEILLGGLSGRTWSGKQHLLSAVVDLCVCTSNKNIMNQSIILDAIFKECRKKEPIYKKFAISALGDLLEAFNEDRFEEFYTDFGDLLSMDAGSMEMDSDDITEKTESRKNYLALKETIWESFGKAWSQNFDTQEKYRHIFVDRCSECLTTNTRNIQLKIMITLNRYVNKLIIVYSNKIANKNTVIQDLDKIVEKIISVVHNALDISYTSIKREALGVVQTLLLKFKENPSETACDRLVEVITNDISPKVIKDKAPEIQSRIRDLQDNMKIT